jgi:predicted ATP-grasp superfamily ATP-dependent carboligase
MYKVLIGEISSYKSIVIARYLKSIYNDIVIYSYDYKKFTKIIHTKYVDSHFILNNIDTNSYLNEIAKLVNELNVDVFFPIHSDFIGEILKKKDRFGCSLNYLGDYDDYLKLHIKNELQLIARRLSLDIPIEFNGFKEAVVPFVIKPPDKSSSKGIVYIDTIEDKLKFQKHEYKNYIFQEYIYGVGCGYSVYAENGIIKVGYGHIRLAEYPIRGGSSVYRESYVNNTMKLYAKTLLEKVKWTGFAMFEFKLTTTGRLVLIEVNPRIWGSINQGLQNGINYFESVISIPPKKMQIKTEVKTYLTPQIFLSLFLYLLNGNFNKTILFLRNRSKNKPDISFTEDIKGWCSVLLRFIFK